MTSYNIMSPKHIIIYPLNYRLKSNFVHHNKKMHNLNVEVQNIFSHINYQQAN
jgi:hypothetical protein